MNKNQKKKKQNKNNLFPPFILFIFPHFSFFDQIPGTLSYSLRNKRKFHKIIALFTGNFFRIFLINSF